MTKTKEVPHISIRKNLSGTISGEQFAISTFEAPKYLQKQDQMSYARLPKEMRHCREWWKIVNENLVKRDRYHEFLKVIAQTRLEFTDPHEIAKFFLKMGVDTRTDNIWEMYLEQDDLLCNYCFQVNLSENAPFFVEIKAFIKR